jgi:hypothetical protein
VARVSFPFSDIKIAEILRVRLRGENPIPGPASWKGNIERKKLRYVMVAVLAFLFMAGTACAAKDIAHPFRSHKPCWRGKPIEGEWTKNGLSREMEAA